ncbi:MAG: signal recognition particle-docking protein FtsY [Desulfocapsa sp.]|nr:signal recognition particle-docking protein FtsY [Desulfocapsa sp.]MBN4048782.1 signal recognition particle-docking protein FtsY [bacterium AH-315-N22]
MLGWFKKKFSKKEETAAPVEELPLEPAAEEEVLEQQAPVEEVVAVEGAVADEKGLKTPGLGSMFRQLSTRLSLTKESLVYRIDTLFLGKKEIDADLFDELEEILITADLGINTTMEILDDARKRVKRDALSDPKELRAVLKEQLRSFIIQSDTSAELVMPDSGPFVIMVVGVNGVGKTTTIGKITNKFKKSGQSVLLVAADTFRAAAVAQLKIWGERNNVNVVHQHEGADPSAVAFDAIDQGVAGNYDVVIVDTAGRLHTQVNLMEELKKIKRVMGKKLAGAPHEILLVLDATTGQNAISQAKLFNETVGITGLALTKLDGTAKGGIVANICRELGIPIRFIGIGEQIDDLRDFDPDEFIDALFGEDSYTNQQ